MKQDESSTRSDDAGTPQARMRFIGELAEKYCGHSRVSAEPPELAIERALAARSERGTNAAPGNGGQPMGRTDSQESPAGERCPVAAQWVKAPKYWRPTAHAYVMFSSPLIEGIYTTVGNERYILSVQPFPDERDKP